MPSTSESKNEEVNMLHIICERKRGREKEKYERGRKKGINEMEKK